VKARAWKPPSAARSNITNHNRVFHGGFHEGEGDHARRELPGLPTFPTYMWGLRRI
jgi:hypothetical protein